MSRRALDKAASLGHNKPSTTLSSYAAPGAKQAGDVANVRERLADVIPMKRGA